MPDFTQLLTQTTETRTESLNLTLEQEAHRLNGNTHQETIERIILAYREQRDRWNTEQRKGSRKRVTSAQVKIGGAKVPIPKGLMVKKPVI